jgi:ribokinase
VTGEQLHPYDIVIGTGGLGTGTSLALEGNHTLGREESRTVRMLDVQDRCKLHIITHYIARLAPASLRVVPVGRVGNDAMGHSVVAELAAEGMDVTHVGVDESRPTLHSVCFGYPDGDGGNLTVGDSASSAVTSADIESAEALFAEHAGRGIALSAPEVTLDARVALLRSATRHGFLRFASFLSGEIRQAAADGVLDLVDVLSINIDEAAALSDHSAPADPQRAVDRACTDLRHANPNLRFCITAGRAGSWVWDGDTLHHQEPVTVEASNTAGAGDAHLGGLILGSAAGLDLVTANEVATALSALSVTSADTINTEIDHDLLARFARRRGLSGTDYLGTVVDGGAVAR